MSPLLIACLVLAAAYAAFRLIRQLRPPVDAAEAARAIEAGTAVLVDVREAGEWAGGVAGPATLLALSDLRRARRHWQPFLEANRSRRLYLYCLSGARSGSAAATLRREGFDAVNLGSLGRWRRAGLPVRQP